MWKVLAILEKNQNLPLHDDIHSIAKQHPPVGLLVLQHVHNVWTL